MRIVASDGWKNVPTVDHQDIIQGLEVEVRLRARSRARSDQTLPVVIPMATLLDLQAEQASREAHIVQSIRMHTPAVEGSYKMLIYESSRCNCCTHCIVSLVII
jgi:hypothetical protein